MEIVFKKQPEKYLKSTDKNTYKKLMKAVTGLSELNGDIIKLEKSKTADRKKDKEAKSCKE